MSYGHDWSYCYSSGDDSFSFSYISDPCYCPVHNYPPPPPPPPPQIGICPIHQPYPYYNYRGVPQQQVSNEISSSTSMFQVGREKNNRRFSPEQIRILEEHFNKVDKYVSKTTIDDLSTRTQLKPAQIRVWFNNKRTRERH
ncbi:unnamed protein product [Rotaria sordida]|uniref:Homeobox domain-containing protein n=1 Tax=Rotaria sordida TaxID=392033 RepID=A0A819DN97_9BILA|nr:unnamed protein product [Rotaria sordida]